MCKNSKLSSVSSKIRDGTEPVVVVLSQILADERYQSINLAYLGMIIPHKNIESGS